MKKIKKVSNNNVANNWFDSENASLIILCATLGIFGAHKFAQHKIGQGILFLLFDITIFGLIVSFIWAFLDLIFLTAKPTNKPGNMILGSMFIILNLSASMFIGTADLFVGDKSKVATTLKEEIVFEKNMTCHIINGGGPVQDVEIIANTKKVDLVVGTDLITVPVKINSKYTNIYDGYWGLGMQLLDSTNPQDKMTVKVNKDKNTVQIIGRLNGVFAEYECE